jgi:hypothetical protein
MDLIHPNNHCKNCGYLWNEHPDGAADNETFIVVCIMAKNDTPHPDCKCKRFYPIDNLEYLEEQSKKDG